MNYFIHINDDNTIDSINTYRKSGWTQYDIAEIFEPYDKIITIDECDTATEAAKRLLAGLEDGEFLGQCDPEPEQEQVEELYENFKIWLKENPENSEA